MLNKNKIEVERFIYAFVDMSLSEYAEELLYEYNNETNQDLQKRSCYDGDSL